MERKEKPRKKHKHYHDIRCEQCGAKIDDNGMFCGECGTKNEQGSPVSFDF